MTTTQMAPIHRPPLPPPPVRWQSGQLLLQAGFAVDFAFGILANISKNLACRRSVEFRI
jgi:hypothetical protein